MGSLGSAFLRGPGVIVPVAFTVWLVLWFANGAAARFREVFLFVLLGLALHRIGRTSLDGQRRGEFSVAA